jgi:hypothetical protein
MLSILSVPFLALSFPCSQCCCSADPKSKGCGSKPHPQPKERDKKMKAKIWYNWNAMSIKKQIKLADKLVKKAAKGDENAKIAHRAYIKHITQV